MGREGRAARRARPNGPGIGQTDRAEPQASKPALLANNAYPAIQSNANMCNLVQSKRCLHMFAHICMSPLLVVASGGRPHKGCLGLLQTTLSLIPLSAGLGRPK